ncbi:hypothetical protein K502DRAFT_343285 [Neoconidiobolus thromboides FSU 785]|nr:hypothetical protein K502DRAFT_343285 [Neoconidiobolus thromboides FSU 785]
MLSISDSSNFSSLSTIWIVATLGVKNKVNVHKIQSINLKEACKSILISFKKVNLRVSANLLLGVVKVLSKKVELCLALKNIDYKTKIKLTKDQTSRQGSPIKDSYNKELTVKDKIESILEKGFIEIDYDINKDDSNRPYSINLNIKDNQLLNSYPILKAPVRMDDFLCDKGINLDINEAGYISIIEKENFISLPDNVINGSLGSVDDKIGTWDIGNKCQYLVLNPLLEDLLTCINDNRGVKRNMRSDSICVNDKATRLKKEIVCKKTAREENTIDLNEKNYVDYKKQAESYLDLDKYSIESSYIQ